MSNGSMMKVTPLAVWARNLSLEELEHCVKEDVSMMHSQPAMWNLVTAYCLAIKTLINRSEANDRAQLALEAVQAYGEREGVTELILQFMSTAKHLAQQRHIDSDKYFTIDSYNP